MNKQNQIPQILELSPAIENAPYVVEEVSNGQQVPTSPQTCCDCCTIPGAN